MNKSKFWKYLTILVTTYLTLSFMPEMRIFGAIIDAIGLEVFLMFVGSNIVIFGSLIYHGGIKSMFVWLNKKFEHLDPFYFVPKISQIKECPQLIFHSIPFMIAISFLLFAQVAMFS